MENTPIALVSRFATRIEALQKRVNEAADALHAKGIKPTVQRIRAALGGGSPNDLTPALKHWREEIYPTLQTVESNATGIPPPIADLARELWTRALAAAEVDRTSGPGALARIVRTEEVHGLREQIRELRDQLEKEAIRYGELRAQAARHEVIAREALGRVRELEQRERRMLSERGAAAQRRSMVEARAGQSRPSSAARRRGRPLPRPRRESRAGGRETKPAKPKRASTATARTNRTAKGRAGSREMGGRTARSQNQPNTRGR